MRPNSRWLNFAGAAVMLIVAGGLGLLAWGVVRTSSDEDQGAVSESSPSPSPVAATPSAVATPMPSPSVAPMPVPGDIGAYRAIFVRNPAPLDGRAGGEIWIAGLDGSNRSRLTVDGESATLAGLAPHPSTSGDAAFVVSLDGGSVRTVWAVDIATSERLNLFTFEAPNDDDGDASVSPSGRYVAYAHVGGIDNIDLTNGQRRHLLDNGLRDCNASNCLGHGRPQWSPDGTLIIVRRGFWEGGTTVILDPFAGEIVPITNDSPDGPSSSYWSPDGNSACGHTGYGESYLNIAQRPDWVFSKVPGYEQADWGGAGIVASCTWVTTDLLAFVVNVLRPDTDGNVVPEFSVELLTYDRSTGSARRIAAFDQGIQIVSAGLHTLPSSRWVVTQNRTEPGSADDYLSQPEVFNVDTGARTPVLQPGDWVVSVLPP